MIHDFSFTDLLTDSELRELVLEWLKPTEQIKKEINLLAENTVLEETYMTTEQRDNKLVLKYYLEEPVDSYTLDTIYQKQKILDSFTFPFLVEVEVYEPRLCMKLSQRGDNNER